MNGDQTHVESVLLHLRREHERIEESVEAVRAQFEEEASNAADHAPLCERLDDLRRRMLDHFAEEEREGCLEEAVSRRPAVASLCAKIVAEHRTLAKELDELIAAARERPGARSLKTSFDAFALRLLAHEERERDAVKTGLNVAP